MEDTIGSIIAALGGIRVPAMPGEYDIHAMIAEALAAAGLPCAHEVKLAPRCRIDFAVGRVGIEVKKGRPAPSELKKQLSRYLESELLDAIVVVTQRAVPLPGTLKGKRVEQVSLNRLWGVALP